MRHSLWSASALAFAAHALLLPAVVGASDRALPMRFELHLQGPAEGCGSKCKTLIAASGAITVDTPRDFLNFAKGRNLTGATLVLDSDGGSVHGAIALGREVRRLKLDTMVGHTKSLPSVGAESRVALSPYADCESMCAFVLIAGVHRVVPDGARVRVHQIWLGDRRDDPTAANYSAEDLVLVQRDIGRLAQYTAEMGVSIDLLDLSLRIPPWEPMHAMTREELVRMKVSTQEMDAAAELATMATSRAPAATPQPAPRLTNGARATPISGQRWAMIDRSGAAALARRHPLTVEGDTLGSFDLIVSCGASGNYDVSYVERRRDGERRGVAGRARQGHAAGGRARGGAESGELRAQESRRAVDLCRRHGAGCGDRRICRRGQPLVDGRNRECRHGHRHPHRQHRRPAEPAAAFRRLCKTAGRPRRARGTEDRRLRLRGEVRLFSRSRLPGLDLVERRDHRIEGEHGGGVARLVVAHRLEHRDVGPSAVRRRAVLLQHLAHGLAQFAQFRRLWRRSHGGP